MVIAARGGPGHYAGPWWFPAIMAVALVALWFLGKLAYRAYRRLRKWWHYR